MSARRAKVLRALFFAYLAITFLHIAYVVYHEPYAFDAWNVSVDTEAKPGSLGRFFTFWHQQYTTSNPRIGQPITYFAYKYVGVAELGTPLAFLAIVLGGFILAVGRWPSLQRGRDLATLAVGIGFLWFAAPNFPSYLFCRAYATNYVWTAALQIWFLVAILHDPGSGPGGPASRRRLVGLFAFGIVAGMCNEHTGPSLLLFVLGYGAYRLRKDGRHAWPAWAGALGTFVGYALIFFAPGQSQRYDEFIKQKVSLTEQILLRGFSGNLEILKGYVFGAAPVLMLLLAVIAIGLIAAPREPAEGAEPAADRGRQRRALLVVGLSMLAGVLIAMTIFASPKLGPRFYLHSVVLLVGAMMGTCEAFLRRPRTFVPFVVIAVLASVYAIARTVPMYTRLHRDAEVRLAELAATPIGGVYTAQAWEQVPESWWFLGDDFRDQKKRELAASYFGLDRVLFRGRDMWATLGITDVKVTLQYEFDRPMCLDEVLALNLDPFIGRDVPALHHAFLDAITEIQRVTPARLTAIDLVVTFLGTRPPMPSDTLYLGRWNQGAFEGHTAHLQRAKRSKDRELLLSKSLRELTVGGLPRGGGRRAPAPRRDDDGRAPRVPPVAVGHVLDPGLQARALLRAVRGQPQDLRSRGRGRAMLQAWAMAPVISIVAPAYNEQRNLPEFLAAIIPVLESTGETFEIVFVNDGSRDDTLGMLAAAASQDPRIKVIGLARNFGKDIALSAGLAHASGEAIIPIDCDLQHPVELIPQFVAKWREGFDMVLGVRSKRDEEGFLRRSASRTYYRVMRWMTSVEIPPNAGDFRLIDRKILDVINKMPERHRFMKGIFAWPGFKVASIEFQANVRANETRSSWSFFKLWRFALDGLFSFSTAPLKIWTYVGLLSALGAFVYLAVTIVQKLCVRDRRPGLRLAADPAAVLQRPDDDLERHPGRVHRAHLRGGEGAPAVRRRPAVRVRAGRGRGAHPRRRPGHRGASPRADHGAGARVDHRGRHRAGHPPRAAEAEAAVDPARSVIAQPLAAGAVAPGRDDHDRDHRAHDHPVRVAIVGARGEHEQRGLERQPRQHQREDLALPERERQQRERQHEVDPGDEQRRVLRQLVRQPRGRALDRRPPGRDPHVPGVLVEQRL